MTGIPRDQLMKDLLPGVNKLFGLQYESMIIDELKSDIAKKDEEFVSKDVYLRVVEDYERKLDEVKDKNMQMLKRVALEARKDGVHRAATFVEGMAEEIGNSNLLHAVVLALHNMDVPE